MLRKTCLLLAVPLVAHSDVVNVTLGFTPYVSAGPATIPGIAHLYVNDVLFVDSTVEQKDLQGFDTGFSLPGVLMDASAFGPRLRQKGNVVRVVFDPADAGANYQARLTWANVDDATVRTSNGPGQVSETNMSGEGKEDKKAKGEVTIEHRFDAPFATDLPWHHFAPVTSLTEADKSELLGLLSQRAQDFKPPFTAIYKSLESVPGLHMSELRKMKCFDQAYAKGLRVTPLGADDIAMQAIGKPEVVVQPRAADAGSLYKFDRAVIDKVKGEDNQFCVAIGLQAAYAPRFAAAKMPDGHWQVVY